MAASEILFLNKLTSIPSEIIRKIFQTSQEKKSLLIRLNSKFGDDPLFRSPFKQKSIVIQEKQPPEVFYIKWCSQKCC